MFQFSEIHHSIILEVTGPDAARYLQARLTNDVKALTSSSSQRGQGMLAGMLSPQGKTEGLFVVVMLANDRFLLIADGGDRESVLSALRRYIVADRVEINERSDSLFIVHLYGEKAASFICDRFSLDALPKNHLESIHCAEALIVFRKRSADGGFDVIAERSIIEPLLALLANNPQAQSLNQAQQECLRISAGIPAFPKELNPDRLFSESEIRSAISHKKGCYVGQEVVEKISARGRPPRILRFANAPQLTQPPAEGAPVMISPTLNEEMRTIGKVLSACYDPNDKSCAMFIDLKNDEQLESGVLSIDGKPLTLQAMGIE